MEFATNHRGPFWRIAIRSRSVGRADHAGRPAHHVSFRDPQKGGGLGQGQHLGPSGRLNRRRFAGWGNHGLRGLIGSSRWFGSGLWSWHRSFLLHWARGFYPLPCHVLPIILSAQNFVLAPASIRFDVGTDSGRR